MIELEVPSKSLSSTGDTDESDKLCKSTNCGSTKQCVEPESTNAETESENAEEVRGTRREFGSERADALRRTSSIGAQVGITQSSVCAEV